MNILVIGSGGREHALCWKIAASPLTQALYCLPGNAGIAQVAECVPTDPLDFAAVTAFCRKANIGFVVVGPEGPLAAGIVNHLAREKIKTFGPSKAAAQLEASKGFTKDLCAEFGIPTGHYKRFKNATDAKAYASDHPLPLVVKADGLAAGKGVIIATTRAEAGAAINSILSGEFGAAGAELVIEEFLDGEEASYFALCDGLDAIPLATAQDHKRAFDGDKGPNTGGMGAYSPAPVMTPSLCDTTMAAIVRPTLQAMVKRGTPFRGILFAGLMITNEGPQLIEYNARFGDPECQVLMMRLKSDIVPALLAACDAELKSFNLMWHDEAALSVVMATRGYPGDYPKGSVIGGLDEAAKTSGVEIFHAGTTRDAQGRLVANGGRVLNVTARGKTVKEAQQRAYEGAGKIKWPEGFFRSDIGWRAAAREL
jgi:phosphoribosylamine---glycine ligase